MTDPQDLLGAVTDPATLTWQRSTFTQNTCVEVAQVPGGALFRNSTIENSPVVPYTTDELRAFILGVKNGEFDGLLD
ncbi:DUF397 domain-containing protein [Saccharothrix lopnurensis]|uniref:DUF397 domain-containing protein n=1 Tax=Saccharothrix lopnurensis TaxID=1670621 RepID=A0ABW1PFS9_9PSEU